MRWESCLRVVCGVVIILSLTAGFSYDWDRSGLCSRIRVGMWEALNPQPPIDYFSGIYCVGNFFKRDRPPIPYNYYIYTMTPVNNDKWEKTYGKAGLQR